MEEEKTISQQLLKKATEEGKIPPPFLQLATQVKDENGNKKGVKGTGSHTVKFISDKEVKGENFKTKEERKEVEYIFEENGIKKRYNVPVHSDKGELHYFVQRMAEVQKGETITLEYKKIEGSFKGYIQVDRGNVELKDKGAGYEEIPIIEDDREIPEEIPF